MFLKKTLQIFTFENKFGEKTLFMCFLTTPKNYVHAPGKAPQNISNFSFFALGTNLVHLELDVVPTPNPDPDPQIQINPDPDSRHW